MRAAASLVLLAFFAGIVSTDAWIRTIEVRYDVELHCPLPSWTMKRKYYELDVLGKDLLYETEWEDLHQPVYQITDVFEVIHELMEFDRFYEPEVVLFHNCGSTYRILTLGVELPAILRTENHEGSYKVALFDQGKKV